MNKKAVEFSLTVVIVAVILLISAIVIIATFSGLFGKEKNQIETQISSLGDKDNDKIADFVDKCPCTFGTADYDGCPSEGKIPKNREEINRELEICKK